MFNAEKVYRNLTIPQLIEHSLKRGEGVLTKDGALAVNTGKYTGRSPEDRFIVDEPESRAYIDWGKVNRPFPASGFNALQNKLKGYFAKREAYVFDGFVGADPAYSQRVRVITSLAYHSLFATQIFRRAKAEELVDFKPDFTILSAPKFKADPAQDGTRSEAFVILSFAERMVLIGGTEYAGEIKKSMFSVMNYLLPKRGVLPMHCSANIGVYDDVALFFGLSGTGKTTLSADPDRRLIGDDEHAWSEEGVFNIEGGCYAKCIGLSKEHEPQIWNALTFGSLLENVVLTEDSRVPDYHDDSITENTRACYPVEYIPNAVLSGQGGLPQTIVFLTADAFGVLPPVARLTREQAMYHFISGYTSKLAGTERGITKPEATFSACFGSPFLPLCPTVYAKLLGQKIDETGARVFLVNTGWVGGGYGTGRRISIAYTRAIITAILSGDLDSCAYKEEPFFNLLIPEYVPGLPTKLLNPRTSWSGQKEYDDTANHLALRFCQNFAQFDGVPAEVKGAGPGAGASKEVAISD